MNITLQYFSSRRGSTALQVAVVTCRELNERANTLCLMREGQVEQQSDDT